MYFYTLFHLHVFLKNTNNVTRKNITKHPLIYSHVFLKNLNNVIRNLLPDELKLAKGQNMISIQNSKNLLPLQFSSKALMIFWESQVHTYSDASFARQQNILCFIPICQSSNMRAGLDVN